MVISGTNSEERLESVKDFCSSFKNESDLASNCSSRELEDMYYEIFGRFPSRTRTKLDISESILHRLETL